MEEMIYNSQMGTLAIPEYGRHVQNLVAYAKTIEDPEKRQNMANAIVDLMSRMNPQQRMTLEFKDKLWKHFFRIANYEIDVKDKNGDSFPEAPESPDLASSLPEYPEYNNTFRHYGSLVKTMVAKALEMEEGPIRDGFVQSIGSYMKLAYKTWNREHYVSDDIIKEDLIKMTDGAIRVDDDVALNILQSSMPSSNPRHRKSRGKSHSNHSRGKRNYKSKRRK